MDVVNARPNCRAVSTSRLEMENYVHHSAINACAQALNIQCNLTVSYGHDDDVPTLLAAELNLTAPQQSKWGANRVKGWLADTVVPTMDGVMFAHIDPHDEMQGWMNTIATLMNP